MSEKHKELKKIFTFIYDEKFWGFGSGIGSLPDTTMEYRYFLEKFIAKNDIKTIVDFGCGDWQFSRYIYWWDAKYTGYDIVDTVIERNRQLYSTDKIMFLTSPKNFSSIRSAELLIVKDVFQHWNTMTIKDFLESIKEKFRYILVTNSYKPNEDVNKDISIGEVRPINLMISPFNIPAEQVFSYEFHCSSKNGATYSDFKNTVLLKHW